MQEKAASTPNKGISIDMIISKFVPVVGAIFLIIGFAYLLYTSVWVNLAVPVRLGLGFFLSLAIIGSGFSFSDRLKYFSDVVIGAGVLLLYGTLIYGSRTTEAAVATIPELASIVSSFFFTISITYLARLRKSEVILIISLIGAYITPFVIGQNDSWNTYISFNAYLLYFLFVNISAFFLGRDISTRHIIPANILGLLVATTSLYALQTSAELSTVDSGFFSGSVFSSILFGLIAVTTVSSIVVSSTKFRDQDEFLLSIGYLVPVIWLVINLGQLDLENAAVITGIIYALVSASYFGLWYYLRALHNKRYQHIALYVGAVFALVLALRTFLVDYNAYTSLLFPYIGLIFGIMYVQDTKKGERFLTYWFMSGYGAMLVLFNVYFSDYDTIKYHGIIATLGLLPAILGYLIASMTAKTDLLPYMKIYSATAGIIAAFLLVMEVIESLDIAFSIFILPGLIGVIWAKYAVMAYELRGNILRTSLIWLTIGFVPSFLTLIGSIYPAPENTYLWTNGTIFTDWTFIKGLIATITYFVGLSVSRSIQVETKSDRPSFLLVIFGYTSLLLTVTYSIYAGMNDAGVPMGNGGPRAVATTIWWSVLALWMLISGIRNGHGHRSEKLLGLLLLALTVGKILLYDLATMATDKKIIVLMVVGGALMVFSYFIHQKGWLKDE